MKGLLYAACSLHVTLIGATHEGTKESAGLENQPSPPCMTMYPQGMLSVEKRGTPYFLDPLFFSCARIPRVVTECDKHPVATLKHSLASLPAQGAAASHLLLPSLKEPFFIAEEPTPVSIPEYLLAAPDSAFFSTPNSILLSALATTLSSIPLSELAASSISLAEHAPEPVPVIIPASTPAPVSTPAFEQAPVIIPTVEPVPVIHPSTEIAPAITPATEIAPVVNPTPESAPVINPPSEPAPVTTPAPETAPVITPKPEQATAPKALSQKTSRKPYKQPVVAKSSPPKKTVSAITPEATQKPTQTTIKPDPVSITPEPIQETVITPQTPLKPEPVIAPSTPIKETVLPPPAPLQPSVVSVPAALVEVAPCAAAIPTTSPEAIPASSLAPSTTTTPNSEIAPEAAEPAHAVPILNPPPESPPPQAAPLALVKTEEPAPALFQSRSVDASFREKTAPAEIQKAIALQEQLNPIVQEKEIAKAPSEEAEDAYPLYEKDPKIFFGKTIAAAEDVRLPPRDQRAQGHLINFRNAPMSDYIRFVASLTGNNFIYREEDVQFFVSVVSKEPTSIENVIHALLQELRIHGLALLQQDNNFIIYPALGPLSPAQLLSPEGPNPEIGTRIFQMKYVSARSVQAIMSRMLSEQAIVQVIVESNSLLITDLSVNIERAAQIIEAVDTLSAAFDMGQYVAVNNRIEDLIPLAEKIIDPLSGGGMPPLFVIQSSTNSAFIIGSSGLVTQAFAILDRLDGREGTTGIFDHAKLIELGRNREQAKTPVLPRLPGTPGGGPATTSAPVGGGSLPGEAGTAAAPGAVGGGLQEAGAVGAARERARLLQEELENQGDVLTNTPEGETVARGTPVVRPTPTLGGKPSPAAPPRTKFYIYKLDFRKGDQLIAALLSIAESLSYDQAQNKLLLDAINSVQWIEASNSIIITGTYEAIMKVKDLIQELDTPLKQILLEMLILDTTLSESITFSVDSLNRLNDLQLSFAQGYISGPQGSQFNTINTGAVTTTLPFDSTPLANVQGFNLGIIGRHICHNGVSFGSIGALIRALHTDTENKVVLNPKIVVEDNFPAAIFVGQNTAFQTQSIANNNGNILTNNVEYRDVGTSLKVTPQIGNGNIITLLIDQEVSAVVSTTGGGQAGGTQAVSIPVAQTTNKATTVTKIHVPDGYFVILSGMLRDEKQFSRSQMPCLGGVPFLGALFSSKSDTVVKRNYIIFIRPKIVECEVFLEETRRNQDIFDVKNKRRPRWKYEADEALDFLNLPRFNEPNDFACTPFGSLGPCQSCGASSFGNCSDCGSEGCCSGCGFCGCCECD